MIYKVLFILSIVVTILSFSYTNSSYSLMILLPMSLFIFLCFSKSIFNTYKKSLVFYLIIFQIFIRYLVLPVSYLFDNDFRGVNSSCGNYAILLMCFELFVIFSFFLFSNYYSRRLNKVEAKGVVLYPTSTITLGLIIFLFLCVWKVGYFDRLNLVWNVGEFAERKYDIADVSAIYAFLFNIAKVMLVMYLISILFKSRIHEFVKVFFLILLLFFNSVFIVGASRFSMILPSIPLFYLIFTLFSKHRRILMSFFSIILILGIVLSTISKFSKNSEINDYSLLSSNSLNAYFSGMGNVAVGIESYISKETNGFYYFINDVKQNIPLLSKGAVKRLSSNYEFNKKIYGHTAYQDQIVPLSMNVMMHFGSFWYLGSILYLFFFMSVAFFFERRFVKCLFIELKYVYVMIAVFCSFVFMLNFSALISGLITNFLMLYCPLFALNKFRSLRKVYNVNKV